MIINRSNKHHTGPTENKIVKDYPDGSVTYSNHPNFVETLLKIGKNTLFIFDHGISVYTENFWNDGLFWHKTKGTVFTLVQE